MANNFLDNRGFELGNTGWTNGTGFAIGQDAPSSRSGSWRSVFTGTSLSAIRNNVRWPVRPGGRISISAYIDATAAVAGSARVRLSWRDLNQSELTVVVGSSIAFGTSGYQQSVLVNSLAPSRAKFVSFELEVTGTPSGTWYIDDFEASGDIIETIPATAQIQSNRMISAETVAVFDPLVGEDKFSEFNAGMSDRWAGVYNFIPMQKGGNLNELLAWIRRIGRRDRFFAYDPDRTVPLNGVVNGMTVAGAVAGGSNRIPVEGGPVSSQALAAGDYVEAGRQYFQLQRNLLIGPGGTGEMVVWPAVRSTIADGEEVITDNPKMVARITSPHSWETPSDDFTRLSVSWEEV